MRRSAQHDTVAVLSHHARQTTQAASGHVRHNAKGRDAMVSVRLRPFTYSHTVGMLALTGRGFSNPVDMTLGDGGVLYVLNRSNAAQAPMGAVRVSICTADAEFIGQFAGFGEG